MLQAKAVSYRAKHMVVPFFPTLPWSFLNDQIKMLTSDLYFRLYTFADNVEMFPDH